MMAMARSSIGEAGQLNRDRVAKFGARQPGHLGCAFRLSKRGERNARRAFSAPITVASLQNQTGPSSGGMRAGLRGVRLPLGVPSRDEADMSRNEWEVSTSQQRRMRVMGREHDREWVGDIFGGMRCRTAPQPSVLSLAGITLRYPAVRNATICWLGRRQPPLMEQVVSACLDL